MLAIPLAERWPLHRGYRGRNVDREIDAEGQLDQLVHIHIHHLLYKKGYVGPERRRIFYSTLEENQL